MSSPNQLLQVFGAPPISPIAVRPQSPSNSQRSSGAWISSSPAHTTARVRLWKWELQKFAYQTGLTITVCHMPPGTSKWNKIEHRLFSFITQSWGGKPLESHATIVKLIASTKTATGLKVYCELDDHPYEKGVKVTDEQMLQLDIKLHEFHGDWNYTIRPNARARRRQR